jgi:hypothetical protein
LAKKDEHKWLTQKLPNPPPKLFGGGLGNVTKFNGCGTVDDFIFVLKKIKSGLKI